MQSRLTCREFVGALAERLDALLLPGPRLEHDRHAAGCTACASYARSYRDTVRLERVAWRVDAEPPAAPEDLLRAILAASRSARP